jgi:hypothetical protein
LATEEIIMSGVAFPNKSTFFQAPSAQRATVAGADFVGGMNKGGSNAPGVGIGTGDYSPKDTDWSEDERLLYESQAIGQAGDDVTITDNDADINNEVSFVLADGDIAVDAELKVGTGALNKTGAVVPTGAWCWGEVEVA